MEASGAPAQQKMVVPEKIRQGWNNLIPKQEAMSYAASLQKDTAQSSAMSGCFIMRCAGSGMPFGCVYHIPCGSGCFNMAPMCVCGVPATPVTIFMNSCEQRQGSWIVRGKGQTLSNACVPLDLEKGTIGVYSVQCCSQNFKDDPDCYYQRICKMC